MLIFKVYDKVIFVKLCVKNVVNKEVFKNVLVIEILRWIFEILLIIGIMEKIKNDNVVWFFDLKIKFI